MAAAKTQYTRASATVNGGSAAPDLNLSSRSLTTVTFKIAFDTAVGSQLTIEQARFYLYSAEPWFREEHSIDFTETGAGTAWTTTGISSGSACETFRDDMKNDVNWNTGNYGIADVLIGFTGKGMDPGTYGCINAIPTSGGTHPYVIISNTSPDMARSVMHEVSHPYGLEHNTSSCSSQIPGIMAPSTCVNYIKNWTPSDDSTMNSRRAWYN